MIRYRHIAVMVLIVLGVAPAWQIAAAQTPSPQDDTLPGQIAYPVFGPERNIYDIYLANADGSDRQVIVTAPARPTSARTATRLSFVPGKTPSAPSSSGNSPAQTGACSPPRLTLRTHCLPGHPTAG